MAEYPPRECGPCPYLAQFAAKSDGLNKDWLDKNTVPKPEFGFRCQDKIEDPNLGVAFSELNPDLSISPISDKPVKLRKINMDEGYKGGIPPCSVEVPPCGINNPPPICCLPGADPVQRGMITPMLDVCKEQEKQRPPCLKIDTAAAVAHLAQATAARKPPSASPKKKGRSDPKEDSHIPCYLPQPDDVVLPTQESMGPMGPWATGRVDWSPLAGLTGIRPVVDKYTITRYSENEWRGLNKKALDAAIAETHRANLIDWNGRQCIQQTFADVDKNQEDNTKRLNQRELELHRWKCEAERAIAAATEEVAFMEEQRQRLKEAAKVLMLPESIAGECLQLRTSRMDSELVRDEVEEQLIKEVALCGEVRDLFTRTLYDVEKQLEEDKTAKARLEYDWSDKLIAHDIDSHNMALNTKSTILMFKPAAVCVSDEQSSHDFWENFTRETIIEGESTRQRSAQLRGTLDNILTGSARDLRSQADRVEAALAKRIACTQELLSRLENELKICLRRLADVETLKEALRVGIRKLDLPVKKCQTRLDNRMKRPRVENCRDHAHFGLLEEAKNLGEAVASLTSQMNQAEDSQAKLIKARQDLEREIMMKRKTLEIDNERTGRIRSFYPSASTLAGN